MSQAQWFYCGSVPDDLVWAVFETFPALGATLLPSVPSPLRREEEQRHPKDVSRSQEAFRNTTVRQFLQLPHTSSRWGCADDAAAFALCYGHRVARPSWTCPTWRSPPSAEDVYTRLARGWSPEPRVGDDDTALLGKDDDRTCTGWNAAVTGCALPCKLPLRGPHFHASRFPLPGDMAVPTEYLPSCRHTTPLLAVAGFDGALKPATMAHVWLTRGLSEYYSCTYETARRL